MIEILKLVNCVHAKDSLPEVPHQRIASDAWMPYRSLVWDDTFIDCREQPHQQLPSYDFKGGAIFKSWIQLVVIEALHVVQ
jgi:hypothetical protein